MPLVKKIMALLLRKTGTKTEILTRELNMEKFKELIAVSLVFLSIVGTIAAIFAYESVLAKRRGTI